MKIKIIKTKKDYEAALKKIDMLFDAKPNTLNGDLLEVLVTLVEAYEQWLSSFSDIKKQLPHSGLIPTAVKVVVWSEIKGRVYFAVQKIICISITTLEGFVVG